MEPVPVQRISANSKPMKTYNSRWRCLQVVIYVTLIATMWIPGSDRPHAHVCASGCVPATPSHTTTPPLVVPRVFKSQTDVWLSSDTVWKSAALAWEVVRHHQAIISFGSLVYFPMTNTTHTQYEHSSPPLRSLTAILSFSGHHHAAHSSNHFLGSCWLWSTIKPQGTEGVQVFYTAGTSWTLHQSPQSLWRTNECINFQDVSSGGSMDIPTCAVLTSQWPNVSQMTVTHKAR